MNRVLLIILFLAILLFGIYSFYIGKFGSAGFNIFFAIICIMGLAIYGFDRLKEIDLKNLKLVLTEIQQTKKDVYAKADEIKEVIIELADNYIYSATETGRFVSEFYEHQKQMLDKRDRAEILYKKADWPNELIQNELDKVHNLIINDFIREINSKSLSLLQKVKTENYKNISKEFQNGFKSIVKDIKKDINILKDIKDYLSKYEIPYEEISTLINDFEYFLINKKLK